MEPTLSDPITPGKMTVKAMNARLPAKIYDAQGLTLDTEDKKNQTYSRGRKNNRQPETMARSRSCCGTRKNIEVYLSVSLGNFRQVRGSNKWGVTDFGQADIACRQMAYSSCQEQTWDGKGYLIMEQLPWFKDGSTSRCFH